MSERESDFEWNERQEAAVRGMQPERSIEFPDGLHRDSQVEWYRKGWLRAMNRATDANLLANRVLDMRILDKHVCPKCSMCVVCDAINLALEIAGRNRAR